MKYSKMAKITYYNGSTNAYSGQVNMEAAIYVDGDIVGAAEYVLYDGELTISDIQVKPEWRRKGMGSRLMKYIMQENPEYTYVPSYKTEDGSKFMHKDLPLHEKMIAKKVYENISFERGNDPKKALGIGLKTITIDHIKMLGQTIKDPPFIKKYLSEYLPDAIKRTDENPTMSPGVSFILSRDAGDRGEMTLYYLWFNKYNGIFYDGEYYPLGKYKKLGEALDFERGIDPKKAMGIGRIHYAEDLFFRFKKDLEENWLSLQSIHFEEEEDFYIEIPLDAYSDYAMNNLELTVKKLIREKYRGKLAIIDENFLNSYFNKKFGDEWPDEHPFYIEEAIMIKIL